MADVENREKKKVTELPRGRDGRRELRKKKKKRRGLRLFFVVAVPVIILSAAICGSVAFFFRVEEVTVSGESRYPSEEILKAAAVQQGENLVLLDGGAVEDAVKEEMPYLGKVKVKKSLPSKVEIQVEETYPAKIVFYNGSYYLVNPEDKVLERVESTEGIHLPIYKFAQLGSEPEPGETLDFLDEISKKIYIDITNILSDNNILESISIIDLSERIALKLQIGDRFIIDLGDYLDLETKLNFAKNIMQRLEEGERGTIDVSNNKKASFLKAEQITPLL